MRVVCVNTSREVWRRGLKFHQCTFAILLLSPLGKGYGPLFEQTWIPFTQKILCGKCALNWPSSFGQEDLKISSMYHCCFIQVVGFITSQDERFHRIPVTSSLISSSRALRSTRINWVIPPALAIAFCNTPITQHSDGQEMICEIYFTQGRQLCHSPTLLSVPAGPLP